MQNVSLNESFGYSTQNDVAIDVTAKWRWNKCQYSISQCSTEATFQLFYSWTKTAVKQKNSVKPNFVKSFDLFLSESVGVGKSHLVKSIYQPVPKVLQYHGGSPGEQHVLIFLPTGVASINLNGITIHLAVGIACHGKFYSIDCNNITYLHNKFWDVELIIIDEISIVSRKLIYQIDQHLIEVFNIPTILLAGKSALVIGDLHQLPSVNAMPVYVS